MIAQPGCKPGMGTTGKEEEESPAEDARVSMVATLSLKPLKPPPEPTLQRFREVGPFRVITCPVPATL